VNHTRFPKEDHLQRRDNKVRKGDRADKGYSHGQSWFQTFTVSWMLFTRPTKMEQSVPKRRCIKSRHRGITQNKERKQLQTYFCPRNYFWS